MPVLQRQFITDTAGNPIGVILPLEEYTLVANTLEQRLAAKMDDKIRLMEHAIHDPLFMADLEETMVVEFGDSPSIMEEVPMPHPRIPEQEIDQRGQDLYDHGIRAVVETPENLGKQIVIDIETGEYAIDSDGLAASRRLLAKRPEAALYGLRIGYNAVYALGGALTPTFIE